jgi:hypothetical protein
MLFKWRGDMRALTACFCAVFIFACSVFASPEKDLELAIRNDDAVGIFAAAKRGARKYFLLNFQSFIEEAVDLDCLQSLIALLRLYEQFDPLTVGIEDPLLHVAVRSGVFNAVQFLLRAGADANENDHLGFSPLMRACSSRNVWIARILLWWDAEPNATHWNGTGAIHIAARARKPELVWLLFAYGARADLRDGDGLLPIELAQGDVVTHDVLAEIAAERVERDLRDNALFQIGDQIDLTLTHQIAPRTFEPYSR